MPGSQGRVVGPRHMPKAITVTRTERPALRRSSTSPQSAREEAIGHAVRAIVEASNEGAAQVGASPSKKAANQAARTERAEQRIIDANDKKRAEEAKIAKEKDVKARLVACNCWTSSSEFIKGGDLKDFIRVNKEHLKSRENYGAQLKFDAAFSFM